MFGGVVDGATGLFDLARIYKEQGISNEQIYYETGYFIALDGNWKSEIDDSSYRFKFSDDLLLIYFEQNRPIPLNLLINHDEFFRIFSKSKNILVYLYDIRKHEIYEEGENCIGEFNYHTQYPTIYNFYKINLFIDFKYIKEHGKQKEEYPSESSAELVILHELQHICQAQRAFRKGASLSDRGKQIDRRIREARIWISEISSLRDSDSPNLLFKAENYLNHLIKDRNDLAFDLYETDPAEKEATQAVSRYVNKDKSFPKEVALPDQGPNRLPPYADKKEKGGPITTENFHHSTIADFKSAETPERDPDFISESGSKYWHEPDAVIRQADHWMDNQDGCTWTLEGQTKENHMATGRAPLNAFTYKFDNGGTIASDPSKLMDLGAIVYARVKPIRPGAPEMVVRISPDGTSMFIAGYKVFHPAESNKRVAYFDKTKMKQLVQDGDYRIFKTLSDAEGNDLSEDMEVQKIEIRKRIRILIDMLRYKQLKDGKTSEDTFIDRVVNMIYDGKEFKSKLDVERVAEKEFQFTDKQKVRELTEYAVLKVGREISKKFDTAEAYEKLTALYLNQPYSTHRTNVSVALGQFSTPAPMAYLMGVFVLREKKIIEKTYVPPKVVSAKKASEGQGYKAFKGVGSSSLQRYEVYFDDGTNFSTYRASDREEAVEEARRWHENRFEVL